MLGPVENEIDYLYLIMVSILLLACGSCICRHHEQFVTTHKACQSRTSILEWLEQHTG